MQYCFRLRHCVQLTETCADNPPLSSFRVWEHHVIGDDWFPVLLCLSSATHAVNSSNVASARSSSVRLICLESGRSSGSGSGIGFVGCLLNQRAMPLRSCRLACRVSRNRIRHSLRMVLGALPDKNMQSAKSRPESPNLRPIKSPSPKMACFTSAKRLCFGIRFIWFSSQ